MSWACKYPHLNLNQVFIPFSCRVMALKKLGVSMVELSDPDHWRNLISWPSASGLSVLQIQPKSTLQYLIYSTDRLTENTLINTKEWEQPWRFSGDVMSGEQSPSHQAQFCNLVRTYNIYLLSRVGDIEKMWFHLSNPAQCMSSCN